MGHPSAKEEAQALGLHSITLLLPGDKSSPRGLKSQLTGNAQLEIRFLPSLSSSGEFSSYRFLGAEHQAAVELRKLPIRDIPVPLLHILKKKSNPEVLQGPQVTLHG